MTGIGAGAHRHFAQKPLWARLLLMSPDWRVAANDRGWFTDCEKSGRIRAGQGIWVCPNLDIIAQAYCFCQVWPASRVIQSSCVEVVIWPCWGSGNAMPMMSPVEGPPEVIRKTRVHCWPPSAEW